MPHHITIITCASLVRPKQTKTAGHVSSCYILMKFNMHCSGGHCPGISETASTPPDPLAGLRGPT